MIRFKKNLVIWIFVILILMYGLWNGIQENFENINLKDLQKKLVFGLNESKVTILKIPPNLIETDTDACDLKCGAQECIQMKEMKKNLTKCIECHQKGKCFHSSIVGGNCDDCLEGEIPINCNDTRHYGCAPPHNIQSYDGSLPYFITAPLQELNSPFDKKCIFCWQFSDYI